MYLTDQLGCSNPSGEEAVLWFLGFLNRYQFDIKSIFKFYSYIPSGLEQLYCVG